MQSVTTTSAKFQIQLSNHNYQLLSHFYDQYSNSLFGIILKVVPDQATAEAILHDAFLTMANSESFFNAENNTSRFCCMTAIVINQCQGFLSIPKQEVVKKIFESISILNRGKF